MASVMTKIGAVMLSPDRKRILVVRKQGREVFIIPGGRPEGVETDREALERELREELQVKLTVMEPFGEFVEPAEFEDAELHMRVYEVAVEGAPSVDSEIVEALWVGSDYEYQGIRLGSTLSRHVVPQLVARGDLGLES